MRGGDPRSRRVAVVPYALLAPAESQGDPALAARLAALRERLVAEGWGLLQAPPAEMDERAAAAALDALADQIADYGRNGYAVAAFPVDGLPGGGVFGDRLATRHEAGLAEAQTSKRVEQTGKDGAAAATTQAPSSVAEQRHDETSRSGPGPEPRTCSA